MMVVLSDVCMRVLKSRVGKHLHGLAGGTHVAWRRLTLLDRDERGFGSEGERSRKWKNKMHK